MLSIVQNGKRRVEKHRSLIKVPQSLIKMPQKKLLGFHYRVFDFGYSAKWKTRNGKPRKNILRGFQDFRVFDLTSTQMMSRHKLTHQVSQQFLSFVARHDFRVALEDTLYRD